MEKLFLETKNGLVPISDEIIKKYGLKKGMRSPFTNVKIVDKAGNFDLEIMDPKKNTGQMTNNTIMFTQSETIDIAKGEDSN